MSKYSLNCGKFCRNENLSDRTLRLKFQLVGSYLSNEWVFQQIYKLYVVNIRNKIFEHTWFSETKSNSRCYIKKILYILSNDK